MRDERSRKVGHDYWELEARLFTVFVDNLPNEIVKELLFGKFLDLKVWIDTYISRKSRGVSNPSLFGFVQFKHK